MPQITIDQHIAAVKNVHGSLRPDRLTDTADRVQQQTGNARAQYQGGKKDVQSVDEPGVHEVRDRGASALYQDLLQAALEERFQYTGWFNSWGACFKRDAFGTFGHRLLPARQDEAIAGACREAARRGRKPAVWIDDDADGLRSINAANGQLRIVSKDRSYSDKDSIDVGPQPVQMIEGGRAIDAG